MSTVIESRKQLQDADESIRVAALREQKAAEAVSEAEVAVQKAAEPKDVAKAVSAAREARSTLEDARAVSAELARRRDLASQAVRAEGLAALKAEEAAAAAAIEPAAHELAAVVREAAGHIIAAWAKFDSVRRGADDLASQLQAQGGRPTTRDPHGLAVGVLGAERYTTVPHVTAHLDPMASAAALTAWEKDAPARAAEATEQQRRREAAEWEARLHDPDPKVRDAAQAELRPLLARFHGNRE